MMITGNIRFAPRAWFIRGNRNASKIRPTGSPNLLSSAALFTPTTLYRRTITQEPPGSEDQNQDEDRENHHIRPPNAYVLVGHGADDANENPAYGCPAQVSDPAQNCRCERDQPLSEAHVEDGSAVKEPEHD